MQKINIIIGRFQPITKGHLKCIDEAYSRYKIPTVICMIETKTSDQRHPFTSDFLLPFYKDLFKGNKKIKDIILTRNADILKIKDRLKEFDIKSWVCGTDRYDNYKHMVDKYSKEIDLIEIKRNDDDVSATQLREYIKEGNREGFYKLFPVMNKEIENRYRPFEKFGEMMKCVG